MLASCSGGNLAATELQAAAPARKRAGKLLRAYYVDAVDVQTLKREQARSSAKVAEAESQLANDGEKSFGSCCRRPRMGRPKGVWILYVPGPDADRILMYGNSP